MERLGARAGGGAASRRSPSAFLHSFANPSHERAARDVRRAASRRTLRVSLSSEVVPEIREYERTSTTVANVYVQDLVERYLAELEPPAASGRLRRRRST